MYRAYSNQIQFLFVYIREAHPSDGRQMPANRSDNVIYKAPTTVQERARIAADCLKNLKLALPCVIDDANDTVLRQYQCWPARACVVNKDGTIAFISPASPRGVNPAEIERALKTVAVTPKP